MRFVLEGGAGRLRPRRPGAAAFGGGADRRRRRGLRRRGSAPAAAASAASFIAGGDEERFRVLMLGEGQAQEGFVRRVLEQAPDQVGHARDELSHRHVLAHPVALRHAGPADGIGHAVQHLDLDRGGGQSGRLGRGDADGDAPDVVRPQGRPGPLPVVDELLRQPLELGVGLRLAEEHRGRPVLLGGEDGLVVPVSALDQTYRERGPAVPGKMEQTLNDLRAVAQIGLDHYPEMRVVAELRIPAQVGERGVGEIPVDEALHVDAKKDAVVPGFEKQRLQGRDQGPPRTVEIERVDLGVERAHLQGDVDSWLGAVRRLVDGPVVAPAGDFGRQVVQQVVVAAGVLLRLGVAEAGLAQDVQGEAGVPAAEPLERGEGVGGVAARR